MELETFCADRSGAVLFNGRVPNMAVFALRVEFSCKLSITELMLLGLAVV